MVRGERMEGSGRHDIVKILRRQLEEHPVQGETFSLYGAAPTTDDYYRRTRELADLCLSRFGNPRSLLAILQKAGRSRRLVRTSSKRTGGNPDVRFLLEASRKLLAEYTTSVAPHLRSLSLASRLDRTISMIEGQYHLAMLEIEIINRLYGEEFRRARTRLAFLPHCLRDWSRECRACPDGHDYMCQGCSKNCWVNGVSKLLRLNGITPYIWMNADLAKLFRNIRKEGGDLSVVGIACVPELVRGMRLCLRHAIPVVGVPLNANRCARWMGKFHDNSVNLSQLARIVGA